MNYEQTKELLKRNGQEQLLRFWDELDETGKEKLLRNIERLDFAVLENLKHPQNLSGEGSRLSPVKGLSVADIEANEQRFKTIGNEALKSGKIAGLLLAGGQGTRLGAEGPKGAFNMGVTRELSIFACQMNNILNDLRESGARPLLLVMTSEKNNEETQEFWKKNGYFGYDAEKVRFFVQDAAPCTDMNGKILQEEKDTPATSPNGNGGWFSSLKKSGLYEELKNGGAEWLNVYAVDNVLQRPFDPVFIGATLESGKACGAKCVRKNSPQEKVGVLCEKDGKAAVIEYYELTEETANARAADGSLEYSYGVSLNYLCSLERLEDGTGNNPRTYREKKDSVCKRAGRKMRTAAGKRTEIRNAGGGFNLVYGQCVALRSAARKRIRPREERYGRRQR